MSNTLKLDRRNLLKATAATAISSAIGIKASAASAQSKRTVDFDQPYNRIGVSSIKWDAAINRYGKDKIVMPMGIADMDFPVAPAITEAIEKRAKNEIYGYEMVTESYYDAIIKWNKERYGLDIKREWIRNSATLKPSVTAFKTVND